MIYLIEYDRMLGKLLHDPIEFGEDDRAEAEILRLSKELEDAGNLNREILLLEAETIENLKNNHGRYFSTIDELKLRIEKELETASLKK